MTITPNSTLADICTAYRLDGMRTGCERVDGQWLYWAKPIVGGLLADEIGTAPTQDQAIEDALFLLAQRRERV